MHEAVVMLFHFLVFPGLLFTVLLGLAFLWVSRKATALVQWRRGPPVSQPLWDVVKLLGKEVIVPAQAWRAGFLAMPFVAFSAAGLATTILWQAALGLSTHGVGDLVVVIYLLTIPTLAIILGGTASGNPLGAVGASRDMKLLLAYELPFVAALLVAVFQRRPVDGETLRAGTLSIEGLVAFQQEAGMVLLRPSGVLAFLVALLCAQAKLGLVPFDLAEAETELGEGALIEYSGAPLAFFKLTNAVLHVTMPLLLAVVFLGGSTADPGSIAALAGGGFLIVVLFVLIRNTNPRVRIDQALRFFWGYAAPAAVVALLLALGGW